jgi:hypothetical protein
VHGRHRAATALAAPEVLERCFPPPLELAAGGGIYVLDDGPIETWRYEFIADAG